MVGNLAFDFGGHGLLARMGLAFRSCGVVFLRRALSAETAAKLRTSAEALLSDQNRLLAAYVPPHDSESGDADNRTGLPFPPNLLGGRFEVVPPDDENYDVALQELAAGPVPRVLASIWDGMPKLFVFLLMAQARVTWDQPVHSDADSVEEVKLQVALQDYGLDDGPPEFLLGSHCAAGLSRAPVERKRSLFPAVVRAPLSAGDAILYFSAVAHRGTANLGGNFQRLS